MDWQSVLELVLKVILYVVDLIGLLMLYGKLGEKKWIAIVPFFNEYALFKRVYSTKAFWIYMICDLLGSVLVAFESVALSIIGVALFIVVIVYQVKFAKNFAAAFGKGKGFAVLTFLFPAAIYLYAGYSKKLQYIGNPNA